MDYSYKFCSWQVFRFYKDAQGSIYYRLNDNYKESSPYLYRYFIKYTSQNKNNRAVEKRKRENIDYSKKRGPDEEPLVQWRGKIANKTFAEDIRTKETTWNDVFNESNESPEKHTRDLPPPHPYITDQDNGKIEFDMNERDAPLYKDSQ